MACVSCVRGRRCSGRHDAVRCQGSSDSSAVDQRAPYYRLPGDLRLPARRMPAPATYAAPAIYAYQPAYSFPSYSTIRMAPCILPTDTRITATRTRIRITTAGIAAMGIGVGADGKEFTIRKRHFVPACGRKRFTSGRHANTCIVFSPPVRPSRFQRIYSTGSRDRL